jgi:hypothetical protein
MTYYTLPTTDKCNLLLSLIEKREYQKYLHMKGKADKTQVDLKHKRIYWLCTAKVETYWRMYFELKAMAQLELSFNEYLQSSDQFCSEINQIAEEIEKTL